MEELKRQKEMLIEHLVSIGVIRSKHVLEAFRRVPREDFVLEEYRYEAYSDRPLPTLRGQTMSAPHMNAILLEELELMQGHRVLEVGTGTGYQAALIAEIVGEEGLVVTIERIKSLYEIAKKNLSRYRNVIVLRADGLEGCERYKPYDRILIATTVEEIPKKLLEQLKPGGVMVLPIYRGFRDERLVKVRKDFSGRIKKEYLMPVAFVHAKRGKEERKITLLFFLPR